MEEKIVNGWAARKEAVKNLLKGTIAENANLTKSNGDTFPIYTAEDRRNNLSDSVLDNVSHKVAILVPKSSYEQYKSISIKLKTSVQEVIRTAIDEILYTDGELDKIIKKSNAKVRKILIKDFNGSIPKTINKPDSMPVILYIDEVDNFMLMQECYRRGVKLNELINAIFMFEPARHISSVTKYFAKMKLSLNVPTKLRKALYADYKDRVDANEFDSTFEDYITNICYGLLKPKKKKRANLLTGKKEDLTILMETSFYNKTVIHKEEFVYRLAHFISNNGFKDYTVHLTIPEGWAECLDANKNKQEFIRRLNSTIYNQEITKSTYRKYEWNMFEKNKLVDVNIHVNTSEYELTRRLESLDLSMEDFVISVLEKFVSDIIDYNSTFANASAHDMAIAKFW